MALTVIERPERSELGEYFWRYVERVPEGHILAILEAQLTEREPLTAALVAKGDFRYEAGKWSVKQVLGHVSDTERVFQYRALCASRGDTTSLPGFDQDPWVELADFDARAVEDLLAEFVAVRTETVRLYRRFSDEALLRLGTADGKPFSVRALAYLLAGHEIHHRQVLQERYALIV